MLLKVLAVAAAATAMAPGVVLARSMDQTQGPAELPPASFKGSQFVDSSGCIFLRAGFGAQTTWVPRVTRDRQLMCGYKPTFAANETRPRSSGSMSLSMPLHPTMTAEAAEPAEAAPAPAPKPQATPSATAASGQTFVASSSPGLKAGQPLASVPGGAALRSYTRRGGSQGAAMAAAAPSGPSIDGNAVQLVRQSQCAGYAPRVSKVYTLSDGRSAISCGTGNTYMVVRVVDALPSARPDASYAANVASSKNVPIAPPAPLLPYRGSDNGSLRTTYARPAAAAPAPAATATTTVTTTTASRDDDQGGGFWSGLSGGAPYERTANAEPVVPPGYEPAWKDGRLNPLRGPRTAQGDAQMDLVWTNQVPRQLVSTTTLKNVGADYPGLRYPNTLPARRAAAPGATAQTRSLRVSQSWSRQRATLSTSNRAQAAAPVAGGRYVQVGMFGVPANAARTAARLQALGYPVATSRVRSNGRELQTVMAGPFASPAQLSAALGRVRQAGFGDAYIR